MEPREPRKPRTPRDVVREYLAAEATHAAATQAAAASGTRLAEAAVRLRRMVEKVGPIVGPDGELFSMAQGGRLRKEQVTDWYDLDEKHQSLCDDSESPTSVVEGGQE